MIKNKLSGFLGCVFAIICYVTPEISFAADKAGDEQRLIQLERDWCGATVTGDTVTVKAILAEDLTYVPVTGEIVSKQDVLAGMEADKGSVCSLDMIQVRIYGDAAVVVGRITWSSADAKGQYRSTDTFIRRSGRWVCVASQATDVGTDH